MHKHPTIAILMATFEDEYFILNQLDSIMMQTYMNFKLYVSDDSISKKTYKVITQFQKKYPNKIIYQQGPKENYVNNFLSLVNQKKIKADIYLFCDQDDFWVPKKLEHIVNVLTHQTIKRPTLYSSSKLIIDNENKKIGFDNHQGVTPSLQNSFFENIAGGNTMAFNKEFRDILIQYNLKHTQIPSHDWWCYILAMVHNAKIILDDKPLVLYRQHNDSLIGFRDNFFKRMYKIFFKIVTRNFMQHQNNIAEALLQNQQCWKHLSISKELDKYLKFTKYPKLKKMKLFIKNNYKRQSRFETFLLLILIGVSS